MGWCRPHQLPMDCAADFNVAMQEQDLPPAYRYEAAVHQAQSALPGNLGALEVFRRGLTAGTTGEQLRGAIVRGLATDPDLAFHLLPAGEEPQAADGTRLFPPEEGEQVENHWIWCVHGPAFFPGPAWLLVPCNGEEPPYAYGYL